MDHGLIVRYGCRPMASWTDWGLRAAIILPAALWALLRTAPALPGDMPAAGQEIRPYEARYALYRNGRLSGKLDVRLQRQGERWVLSSEGAGTHGLARILAARDNEEVVGRVQNGHFRPERYTRHTRMATLDDRWTFEFDWEARGVSITHDDKNALRLEMVGEPLDPLTLKLEMRQSLEQPQPRLQFHMVGEDEIDEQNFRLLPPERMETSLGCLLTTPVERIHQSGSRYTRAWHAPDLDNIEVRMEHGKVGGNHFEMRISELRLDGVEFKPRTGCASLQSDQAPPTDRPQ